MSDRKQRKVRQTQKNMAKEMFQTADLINAFGRALLQSDVPQWTVEQLRDLEDEIFGALLTVRSARHLITPIHVKGQNA